jgi:hypothetical protein
MIHRAICLFAVLSLMAPLSITATVPRLITLNGILRERSGQPLSGVVVLIFSLYKNQEGGTPLWTEHQNVSVDEQGRYSVLLGATKADGLPMELFTSAETKWLGVHAQRPGEEEQPRLLLGGTTPFLHTSGVQNVFLGQGAGNYSFSGPYNVAVGAAALESITNSAGNTAIGALSLLKTTGNVNTATGASALEYNTTGTGNTASGVFSGVTSNLNNANTTGSNNTFIGYQAGPGTSGQLNNATAIGANAVVSANNALVLGDNSVQVGIGTATPTAKLDVAGGVRLNTVAPKPTCDATVRGTFWFTQGGAGVKDSAEVCAKNKENTYAWRTLY